MRHARHARHWAAGLAVSAAIAAAVVPVTSAAAHPAEEHPPTTTGCAVIGQGATGAAVKVIQRYVHTRADGEFGSATAASLQKWQTKRHVPATGVVDAATWAALPHGVARHACERGVDGVGTSCATLRAGATGVAVGVLQKVLGLTVDRDFGPQTEAALKAAQAKAKLPATGSTSVRTWAALGKEFTPACAELTADEKAQQRLRAEAVKRAGRLEQGPGTTTDKTALAAMHFEKRQIGKPYRYGATGPKSYDCSGLQMTSYRHAGITIPRTAAEQYTGGGRHLSLAHARQGDLLFYASDVSKPATVYHVVMYVGNGEILDAPYTGTNVQTQPLWTQDLLPRVVRPTAGR